VKQPVFAFLEEAYPLHYTKGFIVSITRLVEDRWAAYAEEINELPIGDTLL
jgi:hypothetical protein